MKPILIKCLVFVGASLVGLLALNLLTVLMVKYEIFPDLKTMPLAESFEIFYFAGGQYVWIIGTILALGVFFIESEKRKWFIAAPVYLPLLYAAGVLAYYW